MTATLRVVLDQLVSATDADLVMASRELARALVAASPEGCEVAGIVPSGGADPAEQVPGLAGVHRLGLGRRELAAAWRLGVAPGVGDGLIHSPTLMAPLVRHDRVSGGDQTVVTLWDLRAWESPDDLPRGAAAWHRTMLKRAERHADAIVVPTHAIAERVAELGAFGSRLRVIAGAAPTAFSVPSDAVGRRRTLGLPDALLVLSGDASPVGGLGAGLSAVARAAGDLPVVVTDVPDGGEEAVHALAATAGLSVDRLHVRGDIDAPDRAALLDAAVALVAPSRRSGFPWRVLEALALGVPVFAVASAVHREVVVDGGVLTGPARLPGSAPEAADADALAEALRSVLAAPVQLDRLAVLAADRGRAFSWHDAAARVWQLHADL